MTEVLVTGLGATTPLGGDVVSTWQAMLAGESGVRPIQAAWAAQLPVQIAATLAVEPTETLERVQARRLDRSQQVALVAAREAWADAGRPDVDKQRLGVVVGTGIGGAVTLLDQDDILEARGARRVSPLTIPMLMPNGPAATVGLEVGAQAGVHAPVSACASGAEAIALGLDMIRSGRADVVVVGGAEACIHPLPLAGFAQMQALSTRNDEPAAASRPFDKARDGFVLGEGAGMLVLEGRTTPVPAAPRSTAGWPAPACRPTPTTSRSPTPWARVRPGPSDRPSPTRGSSRPTSATSTPTPPRRQ